MDSPSYLAQIEKLTSAAASTLLAGHYLAVEIGILTANLVALVFVLTVPHMIYLTYNWKRCALDPAGGKGGLKDIPEAFRVTFPASFWSMATTLLGFLSLFLVQAKPLQQLGLSGSIGAMCALLSAYLIYPPFLLGVNVQKIGVGIDPGERSRRVILTRHFRWVAAGFAIATLLLDAGIFRLDADPSLLSYFRERFAGDLNPWMTAGGSSLLEIVLRDARGRKLDNEEAAVAGARRRQRNQKRD